MSGFSGMGLGDTSTPSMGVPLVYAEEILFLSFSHFARYQPSEWTLLPTTMLPGL